VSQPEASRPIAQIVFDFIPMSSSFSVSIMSSKTNKLSGTPICPKVPIAESFTERFESFKQAPKPLIISSGINFLYNLIY